MRKDKPFIGGEEKLDLFSPIQKYEWTLFIYGAVLCLLFISVVWLLETQPLIALLIGLILYLLKHQLSKIL